jgi:response regulator RpfG family c-di-GMP phosphodiesterase
VDTNKKIVSIVDNEIDITVLFEDALRTKMKDFSIVSFNEPADALDHFKKNKDRYALVISDLRMPTMDGLQLLNKVKKLNPYVRTMLISACEFQNNPIFEKYLNEGIVNTFMEKPIKIDRLCQRVREEFRVYQLRSNKA